MIYLINRNKYRAAAKIGRPRNMPQIKECEKSLEKELNKTEASNLSDTEFTTMIVRMLKNIGREWINSVKTRKG